MKILFQACLILLGSSALLGSTLAFTATSTSRQQHTAPSIAFVTQHHHRYDSKSNNKSSNQHPYAVSSSTRLYMGWGPDPIWSTATVLQTTDACPSGKTRSVTLQVPPETAAAYTVPGQYVQLRNASEGEDAKASFFAIASAPGSENAQFQFLVKQTDAVAWLTSLPVGATVDLSQVLGQGYAVADNLDSFKYDFPTQNVILCAAGSGLAPLVAVMDSDFLQLQANARGCRLYYGEQTADDLCCVDQFARWEQMGVEVVPVLSQADEHWKGRVGYVQTALEEDGIAIPRNSGALLCGMKGMTEAVSELLKKAGVFEGRILFNF